MSGVLQDSRYAVRRMRRNPGFTAAAILTLALGVGATTAMFSLVDRILFRSLPYAHDEELTSVGVIAPIIDGEFLFASNYLSWRENQTAFTSFTSSTGVNDCDLTDEHPVRVACAAVASTFLPTFAVQPVLGRNFTRDEDRPNARRVALIAYSLWQNRFGGDRGVLDRVISLDGQPTRIVGVLPRDFEFPTLAHTDFVVPEALDESTVLQGRMGPVVRVFGRMKPGATVAQTAAELQPQFHDFVESAPPPFRKTLRLEVRSIRDLQTHDSRRAALLLMLSAVAVLLISCANSANLVLAHSVARRMELGVRSALGAGRIRLFRQRLTESILLALLGGAGGTALAYAIVHAFAALAPQGIPHLSEAAVDARALVFGVLASVAAGIVFGAAPALEKAPHLPTISLAAGERRARLRHALLFAQASMAVVLLGSALLLVRSLRNLQTEPLGMNIENIATAELTLGQKYSTARERLAFFEAVERKFEELPGVNAVALADSVPPSVPARTMPFIALQAEGQAPLRPEEGIGGVVGWRSVTPKYFSVLGIPLTRGRAFNEQDRAGTNSIILNQALALKLFPNQDPIGRTVQFHTDRAALTQPFTVVGVTTNTQNQGPGGKVGPEYYMVRKHSENDVIFNYPDSQHASILVRSSMGQQSVSQELQSAVAAIDPALPLKFNTLSQQVAKLTERPRFSAALLSVFAMVGLMMTAVGVYSVIALLVSQRSQEIAIRIALGASPQSVIRIMVRQSSAWIAAGAVAGVLGSLATSRWIGALLFGVRSDDPFTLAGAVGLLMLVAMVGVFVPALRAAKLDPMVALRSE